MLSRLDYAVSHYQFSHFQLKSLFGIHFQIIEINPAGSILIEFVHRLLSIASNSPDVMKDSLDSFIFWGFGMTQLIPKALHHEQNLENDEASN
jgi:hypothetical protein